MKHMKIETPVMIKFRRNDEALLAATLTGCTWSSVVLVEVVEDKNNMIIRWIFLEQYYWYPEHVSHIANNMETYPSILS